MHLKDNLVTLNFQSKELAKAYAAMAWELAALYERIPEGQGQKFTPEQALFTYLKCCADEFADLTENPICD